MRYLKRQSIFILLGFFLVFGALVSGVVHAQVGGGNPLDEIEIPIATEIIIPGSEVTFIDGVVRGKVGDLANYLGIVYNFLISIVGVVAGVFIMIGGFQYLTAGGDAARVSSAKNRIANALIGMVLALSSFVLLNTINPDLVNLKLPTGLGKKVTTQLAYLPFCDELAKQSNVSESDVKTTSSNNFRSCGVAGFLEKGTTVNEAGETVAGRLWCVFRGNAGRNQGLNGGCEYDVKETAETFSNNNEKHPNVCMIFPDASSTELDKEFSENGSISSKIGSCEACWTIFDDSSISSIHYGGDMEASCQAWMNTANNGNPNDFNFTYDHKQEVGFNLENGNADRVYYCGLRDNGKGCTTVEIECKNLDKCSEYDDDDYTYIYFCSDVPGGVDCRDEPLKSRLNGTFALHLGRVCRANPCGATGKCSSGAVTDTLQQTGISTGGGINTVRNGLSFGFLDICED